PRSSSRSMSRSSSRARMACRSWVRSGSGRCCVSSRCGHATARNSASVTLVCDNLNTHTKGAFYEAFEPEQERAHLKRIKFCYTPKQGSWLNVAECELSCLTSQCLNGRRIGELPELQKEIAAWAEKTRANPEPSGQDCCCLVLKVREFFSFP